MPERIPVDFKESSAEVVKIKNEADVQLSQLDLGELSAWLEKYNRQFNWGSMTARYNAGEMRGAEETEGEEETVPVLPEHLEKEKHISFAEITQRNKKLLAASGLTLEPVKGPFTLKSAEGDAASSELRINLGDGKKFARYLGTLHGAQLSDTQRTGLQAVARSLTEQMRKEYDLDNPDDERLLELFGSTSQIIVEYARLEKEGGVGLADSVSELKRLFEISKRGYLREQLLAENGDLLAEVGGHNFGPSKWHTDSSVEDYIQRWDRALDIARTIGKNPKARELLKQVVDNLIASVEYIERDIEARRTAEGKKRP